MLFSTQGEKQIPRFARNDKYASTEKKDAFAFSNRSVPGDARQAARKCSRLRLGAQRLMRKRGDVTLEFVKAFVFSGLKRGLRLKFGRVRAANH